MRAANIRHLPARLAVAAVSLAFCVSASSYAGLTIEPARIDMGDHATTEKVAASATVHNKGDKPITVKRIRTSCGCSVAKLESNTIPANSSTKVNLTVDGLDLEGKYDGSIIMMTDDDANPVTIVGVTGMFISKDRRLMARPKKLDMGKLAPGSKPYYTLDIVRGQGAEVGEFQITCPSEWVQWNVDTDSSTAKRTHFIVTITPPETLNRIDTELIILGVNKDDALRVPIIAERIPEIVVTPRSAIVDSVEQECVFKVATIKAVPPAIESEGFDGSGLELVSVQLSPECDKIFVKIKRTVPSDTWAEGKLTLSWAGDTRTIIDFSSPPK